MGGCGALLSPFACRRNPGVGQPIKGGVVSRKCLCSRGLAWVGARVGYASHARGARLEARACARSSRCRPLACGSLRVAYLASSLCSPVLPLRSAPSLSCAVHVGGWVVRVSCVGALRACSRYACVSLRDFLRGLWRWGIDSGFASVYCSLMATPPPTNLETLTMRSPAYMTRLVLANWRGSYRRTVNYLAWSLGHQDRAFQQSCARFARLDGDKDACRRWIAYARNQPAVRLPS